MTPRSPSGDRPPDPRPDPAGGTLRPATRPAAIGRWLASGYRELLEACARPAVAFVLAVLMTLPTLSVGWIGDDLWHRLALDPAPASEDLRARLVPGGNGLDLFTFAPGPPDGNRLATDRGILPWWIDDETRIAFWRPLAGWTHRLDYRLWPDRPALMHLQSILWYGLLAGLAAVFFRRVLGDGWVAGLAVCVFAVDESHTVVVAWLANRNALLTAIAVIGTILAHERWRRTGARWWSIVSAGVFALGLGCAEAGVAGLGYLIAHEFVLGRGGARDRLWALVPYVAIVAAWRLALVLVGAGATGSGFYVDPVGDPRGFIAAVVARLPVLLLSLLVSAPAHLVESFPLEGVRLISIMSWTILLAIVGVAGRSLAGTAGRRFLVVATVLATVPFCACSVHGRNMLIPSLAGLALVAILTGDAIRAIRGPGGPFRRAAALLAALAAFLLHAAFPVVHGLYGPAVMVEQQSRDAVAMGATLPQRLEPDRTLVLATAPSAFLTYYFFPARHFAGGSMPGRLRTLATGPAPVTIARLDDRTLQIRPDGGFLPPPGFLTSGSPPAPLDPGPACWLQRFDQFFSAPDRRWSSGWTRSLPDLEIELVGLTPDGRPAGARFRFDRALEDDALVWVAWDPERRSYRPFRPPAVGRQVRIPGGGGGR